MKTYNVNLNLNLNFSTDEIDKILQEVKQLQELKESILKVIKEVRAEKDNPGKEITRELTADKGLIDIPIRKVIKENKSIKKPKGGDLMAINRICKACGEEYKPQGPRQKYCSIACGLTPKTEREKQLLKLKKPIKLKEPIESIENTLKEIELRRTERNKTAYEFAGV